MHCPTNVEEKIIRDEDNKARPGDKLRDSVSCIRKVLLTYGNQLLEEPRRKLECLLKTLESDLSRSNLLRRFQGDKLDKIERLLNKLKIAFRSLQDDEVDPPDLQSTTEKERSFNPSLTQSPMAATEASSSVPIFEGRPYPSATPATTLAAECLDITQEDHSKLTALRTLLNDEVIVVDDTTHSTNLQSTIEGERRFNPSPPQFPIATTASRQLISHPPTPPVATNPLTTESVFIAMEDHSQLTKNLLNVEVIVIDDSDPLDFLSTSEGTEGPCSTNQPAQLVQSIYERRSNPSANATTISSPEANCLSSIFQRRSNPPARPVTTLAAIAIAEADYEQFASLAEARKKLVARHVSNCNDPRGRKFTYQNPTPSTLRQQQQQNQQQQPAVALANYQHVGQTQYRCSLNNNNNNASHMFNTSFGHSYTYNLGGSFRSPTHRTYREHRLAKAKQIADQQCQLKAKEKQRKLGKQLTIVADKECIQLDTSYLNNKKIHFKILKKSNSLDKSHNEKVGDKCEQQTNKNISINVLDKKEKHGKEIVNVENQPPTQREKSIDELDSEDQDVDMGDELDNAEQVSKKAAEKKTEQLPKLPKMWSTADDDKVEISMRNIVNGKRRRRLTNLSLNEAELGCKALILARLEAAPAAAAMANKRKRETSDDSSYNSSKGSNKPSKSMESPSQTTESIVTPTSGQIPLPEGTFVNYPNEFGLRITRVFSLANP